MTALRQSLVTWAMVGLAALSMPILAADEWASGTVKRIDRDQLKITLQHEEIKSLEMPPMRMVFRVESAGLVDGIAVGDSVRFTAKQKEGAYVVTDIRKSP